MLHGWFMRVARVCRRSSKNLSHLHLTRPASAEAETTRRNPLAEAPLLLACGFLHPLHVGAVDPASVRVHRPQDWPMKSM